MISLDNLTNLPGRNEFNHLIEQSLSANPRMSIISFDICNFRSVNDSLGYEIGDWVLIEIADILRKSIDSTEIVARSGGDEFSVATTDEHSETQNRMSAIGTLVAQVSPLRIAKQTMQQLPPWLIASGITSLDSLQGMNIRSLTVKAATMAINYEEKSDQWWHKLDSALRTPGQIFT